MEKVDAGAKGAAITFHKNVFANPAGLVAWIGRQAGSVKLRPDQRLIVIRDWEALRDAGEGDRRPVGAVAGNRLGSRCRAG